MSINGPSTKKQTNYKSLQLAYQIIANNDSPIVLWFEAKIKIDYLSYIHKAVSYKVLKKFFWNNRDAVVQQRTRLVLFKYFIVLSHCPGAYSRGAASHLRFQAAHRWQWCKLGMSWQWKQTRRYQWSEVSNIYCQCLLSKGPAIEQPHKHVVRKFFSKKILHICSASFNRL